MGQKENNDDELLIQEVLEGDRDRFGTLVEPYIDRLHAISYIYLEDAHAAEDVTQDALNKAFTSLRTLADPGKFGPWLRQITRNLSLSAVRRRKFETIDPTDHRDTADISAKQPGVNLSLVGNGRLRKIDKEQRRASQAFCLATSRASQGFHLLQNSCHPLAPPSHRVRW